MFFLIGQNWASSFLRFLLHRTLFIFVINRRHVEEHLCLKLLWLRSITGTDASPNLRTRWPRISAKVVNYGPEKAPQLNRSRVIWIVASDTICQLSRFIYKYCDGNAVYSGQQAILFLSGGEQQVSGGVVHLHICDCPGENIVRSKGFPSATVLVRS